MRISSPGSRRWRPFETEPHTVVQCIHRQLGHYGYHVGQIVLPARQARGPGWTSLSIPRRGTAEFNAAMKERHSN